MSEQPLIQDMDLRMFFWSSLFLVIVSVILIGIGFFCIWFSGQDLTTQHGFSGAYVGAAGAATAFGIVGLLLGGGWFLIFLYFIAIEWMGNQINKVIKISDDPYAIQVILHFAVPVIALIVVAWVGMHDPHSALCHGNPFGVNCEQMITMQESMGISP